MLTCPEFDARKNNPIVGPEGTSFSGVNTSENLNKFTPTGQKYVLEKEIPDAFFKIFCETRENVKREEQIR